MARTIAIIRSQMTNKLVALAAAVGWVLTPAQWSDYDYKKLMIEAVSTCIATFEQILDAFKVSIETLIATAAPMTGKWWQAQMFKFQYSATDPQQGQLNTTTFVYEYPTINTTYRVIKYASVTSGALGTVLIKIAGAGPSVLDSSTVAAAQNFVADQQPSGITFVVSSSAADKIYIAATIYYKGVYAAVIAGYLDTAINAYLQSIPFDGVVSLIDLEIAIRNTTGVTNVVMNNVQIRADSVSFGSGTDLVLSNATVNRQAGTVAGYVIPETDSGHTLADSLTLIAE